MTRLKYFDPVTDAWELLPMPAYVNEVVVGPDTPVDPNVELWYDTTANVMKVWVNNTWVSTAGDYLLTSGGTLTGALIVQGDITGDWFQATYGADMGGFRITGVATATDPNDAVPKQQLDSRVLYGTAAPSGTGYAPGTIYCQYT